MCAAAVGVTAVCCPTAAFVLVYFCAEDGCKRAAWPRFAVHGSQHVHIDYIYNAYCSARLFSCLRGVYYCPTASAWLLLLLPSSAIHSTSTATMSYRSNRGFPPGGGIFFIAEIVPLGGNSTIPGGFFFFFPPLPWGESTPGGIHKNTNRGQHRQQRRMRDG